MMLARCLCQLKFQLLPSRSARVAYSAFSCNVSSPTIAAYRAFSLLGSRYTTALFGATLAVSRYMREL